MSVESVAPRGEHPEARALHTLTTVNEHKIVAFGGQGRTMFHYFGEAYYYTPCK